MGKNPSCRRAACTPKDEKGSGCHPELVLSEAKDLAKDLLFQAFGD